VLVAIATSGSLTTDGEPSGLVSGIHVLALGFRMPGAS